LEGLGPETHVNKTHNVQYRIQNTEYRIQNKEHRIQNTGCRIQNIETHVHKITNVPVFFHATGVYDLDDTRLIFRAHPFQ
jgi:hypothetical protein